MKDKFRESRGD